MNVLLNVYIFALSKKSAPLLPDMTVRSTLHSKYTDRQRMPTKINKNGGVAKLRILVKVWTLQGI